MRQEFTIIVSALSKKSPRALKQLEAIRACISFFSFLFVDMRRKTRTNPRWKGKAQDYLAFTPTTVRGIAPASVGIRGVAVRRWRWRSRAEELRRLGCP
ncbi:unnamed protein product [Ilex paraguariensis]|uniref:Uncharacterized protein n=1 Tax=Ilex paraguariensis TaxID=185542 RepID=A0ABC8SCC6_9AQUA